MTGQFIEISMLLLVTTAIPLVVIWALNKIDMADWYIVAGAGVILLGVNMFFAYAIIWSLTSIFGLEIPLTFGTILAVMILISVLKSIFSRS